MSSPNYFNNAFILPPVQNLVALAIYPKIIPLQKQILPAFRSINDKYYSSIAYTKGSSYKEPILGWKM